ncbi:cytochrome c oxidase subunit II [Oceanimonas sp. CHS3-5]|uniref:cytochrome c oxidase subunit II n=1 Tax=Oceanimonas sp. CHS3-5 TaxID=3068186 RepID=UPI00273FB3C8|nr:cytochrome c oxidase subunit II [Oceanimonas sp. CHS3-5]MDP5292814.1 cytochrome c oxidase subunit II [Oceanimonas sp. CHS3-5]
MGVHVKPILLLLSLLTTLPVRAQARLNMTEGVTEISQKVYGLHMTILTICAVIGLLVFGAMFWAIIHHRKSKGARAAQFHESTKVEILWTIIPFLILIAMAIPATRTLVAMEDTSRPDLTVQITGSQWKWHYRYFDENVEFYSLLATLPQQISGQVGKGENYLLEVDNPLVLPTDRKVRFLITSDDVIHSWWMPAFAVKKDAIPGFINEAWTRIDQPGLYRGQCAELCGKDHGFMPIVVDARTPEEFDGWLAQIKVEQAAAKAAEQELLAMDMSRDELMSLGEQVYQKACAACHQAGGEGIPGAFPALKGSELVLNDRAGHIDIVLYGKAGTAMQSFDKQLALKELAAVITYERNAWGNDTGDLVQPKDIHQARQEQ